MVNPEGFSPFLCLPGFIKNIYYPIVLCTLFTIFGSQFSIWIGYGLAMLLHKFPGLGEKYKIPEKFVESIEQLLLKKQNNRIGKFTTLYESTDPSQTILNFSSNSSNQNENLPKNMLGNQSANPKRKSNMNPFGGKGTTQSEANISSPDLMTPNQTYDGNDEENTNKVKIEGEIIDNVKQTKNDEQKNLRKNNANPNVQLGQEDDKNDNLKNQEKIGEEGGIDKNEENIREEQGIEKFKSDEDLI